MHLLLLLLLPLAPAFGQLVEYNFRVGPMHVPTLNDPNIEATNLAVGPGIARGGVYRNSFTVTYTSPSDTPVAEDYVEFLVTPKPGHSVTPDKLVYSIWRELSYSGWEGPQDWQLQYSLDGFTTDGIVLVTHDNIPTGSKGAVTRQTKYETDISSIGTQFCTIAFRFFVYDRTGGRGDALGGLSNGIAGQGTGQTYVSWGGTGSNLQFFGTMAAATESTDITISTSKQGPTVDPDQSTQYTVTVSNSGPVAASSVALDVPLLLPFAALINNWNPSSGAVWYDRIWGVGTLAPGETQSLTVTVDVNAATPAGVDTLGIDSSLRCLAQTPLNPSDDSSSERTSVTLDLKLDMTKSVNTVVAGSANENLMFVVTATNIGNSATTGLVVQNSAILPTGATVARVVAESGTSFSGDQWTIGALAKDETMTLTVYITVGRSVADGATIVNTASIAANDIPLFNTQDDTASQTAAVLRQSDLQVTVNDVFDPVIAGSGAGNLQYQVLVKNFGPSDATGIAMNVNANLPSGVSFDSVSAPAGTNWDGTNAWTVGSLAGNREQKILTFIGTALAETGNSVASLAASGLVAQEALINTGNDASAESTTIATQVDLVVMATESIDPVIAGSANGNLQYVVTVLNNGPSDANGVEIQESFGLPNGVTVLQVLPNSPDSYANGVWTLGDVLKPGQSRQLVVDLTAEASTVAQTDAISLTSTVIKVTEARINIPNGNNVIRTSVSRRTDLQVTVLENQDPTGACATNELIYTVKIDNLGPSDSSGSTVSNVLTAPLDVVAVTSVDPFLFGNIPVGTSQEKTFQVTIGPSAPLGSDLISLQSTIIASNEVLVKPSQNFFTEATSIEKTDVTPPVITCPGDIVVGTDSGLASAIVTYGAPVGTDNCEVSTAQTAGLASGAAFPIGVTTCAFTATDASGNAATCTFMVTVNDDELPQLNCPGDIAVSNDAGVCGAVVLFDVTATDNAPNVALVNEVGIGSGSFFPVGSTSMAYTATDASYNYAVCYFSVTVADAENPVAATQPVTLPLSATGYTTLSPAQVNAGSSTDNCGKNNLNLALSQTSFTCGEKGENTVTLTVTDGSGNSDSTTATITVVDETAPTLSLVGDIPQIVECSAPYVELGATATDACDGDVTSMVQIDSTALVDTLTLGDFDIVYAVSDAAANSATSTRTVSVVDTTAPILTLNGDSAPQLECGIDTYTEAGSSVLDACDTGVSVVVGGDTVNTAIPSNYVVTYDAMDGSMNTAAQVVRTVAVKDTTAPVLTLNGAASSALECNVDSYTELGASLLDACDTSLTATIGGDTIDLSTPGSYTVTYDATDFANNVGTQISRSITVQDSSGPIIFCPTDFQVDTTDLDGTTVDFDVTASDVCDPSPAVVCDPASNDFFDIGDTVVSCIATDAAGNTDTCSFIVTVFSPPEMVENLIFDVNGMGLAGGTENALLASLEEALAALEGEDYQLAAETINAFMNKVEAQSGKKITEDEADELIGVAEAILATFDD